MKTIRNIKALFLALTLIAALALSGCGAEKSSAIQIAVPNDTTNEARALLLLEENGIIKLKEGAGIVESHKNNWATALCIVSNYFNQGGLGVYLRILVHPEDVERANEALSTKDGKRAKNDTRKIVIWVVIAAAVFLFFYAFSARAFREQTMCTERFEYR